MDLTAGQMRARKARANLHALNRLNGHECARQTAIEPPIPLRMRAEPRGQAAHDDLKDAAERIPCQFCLVDALSHARPRCRVTAVQIVGVGHSDIVGTDRRRIDGHTADLRDVGGNVDAERREKLAANSADRNAHRRLACTRALEDVTRIPAVVLQHARQIGVSGAHCRDPLPRRCAEGIHAIRPVHKVAVHDLQGKRCADGLAKAQSREHEHAIRLDLHAPAASIAALAARKLGIELRTRELQPRRQTIDDCRQCRAVRFSPRDKSQLSHVNPPLIIPLFCIYYVCICNNFDILRTFPANEQLKVHVPRCSCAASAAVSRVITAWSIVPSAVRRSALNTAVRSPLSTSRRKEISAK